MNYGIVKQIKSYINTQKKHKSVILYKNASSINNVNFSMFLDFTTDSTDIISTIITNFDAYQYTKTLYTVEESFDDKCVDLKGLGMDDLCVDNCEASSIIEEGREVISVEKKYSKEIVPIPN